MSLRALTVAGSYALTATNAAVPVISTQALTVAAASPASGGALPRTGFDPTGLLVGGGLLVLAGAGGVLVARRRRSSRVAA